MQNAFCLILQKHFQLIRKKFNERIWISYDLLTENRTQSATFCHSLLARKEKLIFFFCYRNVTGHEKEVLDT